MKKSKEIYVAGGCFWGIQAYMNRISGVIGSTVGYANGQTKDPKYEDLLYHHSGHAETVQVIYDPQKISLDTLLVYFFKAIDATSLNKQGNDVGIQYRTGIYYIDEADLGTINEALIKEQKKYQKKIVIEVAPLNGFYLAEDEHQDYLDKHPYGYCHIDLARADEIILDQVNYEKPSADEIKKKLTSQQYRITQLDETEKPFSGDYCHHYQKGIYVDIVTGEPLFAASAKFDAGCGWPSFSQPICEQSIKNFDDNSFHQKRIEVRSAIGDSHLGHVFNDGPPEKGGLRYCINSASLQFIAYEEMDEAGYGYLKDRLE